MPLARDSVFARILANPSLPTPPPVAQKVLEKAGRPDCSLADVSRLIGLDPVLCACVLQIVNSAFCSLPHRVTSIRQAVILLGLNRVRMLVLSLSLPCTQQRGATNPRLREHWKASIASAIAAREWAIRSRHADPDNEMSAALMCDLGVHVLREIYPEAYGRILAEPTEVFVRRQCALEEKYLGVNHAEVGAFLLRRWGMPDELTEAIRHHHDPTACPDPVVAQRAVRLHFASLIGQMQLTPLAPSLVIDLRALASERFSVDGPQLHQFLESLHDKIADLAALLHVDIGTPHHYADLLASTAEQLARLASETTLENIRVHEEKEQVDQQRRRSQEELDRLSRSHELLLNAAAEGILGVDRQGAVTFANPAGARLLGRGAEELVGKAQHDVLYGTGNGHLLPPADSPILAVLRDGHPRYAEDGVFVRGGDLSFPVRYNCSPIRDMGEIVGAVLTFQDVSDLKRAEEALRRSEEHLRQAQKMEVVGQLAGGVAHDFNNLLTAINGFSDMALAALPAGSPARAHIEEVRNASERASALTRQLLTFGRQQVLTPRILLLNNAVRDLDRILRHLIGKNIQLGTELAPDLRKVRADPTQIEQVILNLVINARDAMPKGGQIVIETVNARLDEAYCRLRPGVQPGPYVLLAVTDTGCGMDAATQARIFEPFFTTKERGKGTGLGLAIVYGIVKQSGGSIYVYSEVGKGTCFKIYLPAVTGEEIGAPTTPDAPILCSRGQETILVVDNDDDIRNLIRIALSDAGYQVIEAMDGPDALRKAKEHAGRIHLLMTDFVMPGMTGVVLAEQLIALQGSLKVLFMSGYSEGVLVQRRLLRATVAFLSKPFTLEALTSKVRETLDGPRSAERRLV
jgi:PAS domain S-box-containing protein